MTINSLIAKAAYAYLDGGLSLVPINPQTKRPFAKLLPQAVNDDGELLFYKKIEDDSLEIVTYDTGFPKGTWDPYQINPPTRDEVRRWLEAGIVAIAVVGGRVSGGLEILDFDIPGYYERWLELAGELADGLPTQRTGGGGVQVGWRCDEPSENQKLAWHPDETAHSGREIAIETRGEGGYAVIAPSLHPSGNYYELIQGRFSDIPHIDMAVRDFLLLCARQLCQAPKTRQELERGEQPPKRERTPYVGESVIDAYNHAHGIEDALTKYGYTRLNGGRYSRPGKESSGGVIVHKDVNKTYHLSSNDPLDSDSKGLHQPRSPFDYFLEFEHSGDYKSAVKAAALLLGMNKPASRVNGNGYHAPPPPVTEDWQPSEPPPEETMEEPTRPHRQIDALKYRQEDGGILDAWVDHYSPSWIYSTGVDKWYFWDNTHWRKDEQLLIHKMVRELLDYMNRQASEIAKSAPEEINEIADRFRGMDMPDVEKERIDDLKKEASIAEGMRKATKRTSGRVSSIEGMARSVNAKPISAFDVDDSLNLINGTFSLHALELRPHAAEDLFTYQLDYRYDPQATCPQWEKFVSEVLVKEGTEETDPDLVLLFQELLGYSLTTQTKREIMVWMYGDGGNGKSVTVSIIHALLGPMATSVDFQSIGMPGNYDLADVPGKRVLFSTEAEKGGAVAEKYIKCIVTGDPIKARPIYGSPIEFRSAAKIWWAMNDRPIIKDTSDSMWRRMRLLPFYRKFEDKAADVDLIDKLKTELPGILNWAIKGLVRLTNNNAFTSSVAAENAKAQYREESNPVARWVNTMTVKTAHPATLAGALFENYNRWSREQNERPITSNQFSRDLGRLKIAKTRRDKGFFYNLALITADEHV